MAAQRGTVPIPLREPQAKAWILAVALAEEFTGLMRDRAPDRLDPWLQRAGNSTVQKLQGIAK